MCGVLTGLSQNAERQMNRERHSKLSLMAAQSELISTRGAK